MAKLGLTKTKTIIPTIVVGCLVVLLIATGAFLLPGPKKTFSISGLKSRFQIEIHREKKWKTIDGIRWHGI